MHLAHAPVDTVFCSVFFLQLSLVSLTLNRKSGQHLFLFYIVFAVQSGLLNHSPLSSSLHLSLLSFQITSSFLIIYVPVRMLTYCLCDP